MIMDILLLYLLRFAAAMTGTVAFSVLFHAPKRDWVFCGIAGSIG